MFVILLHPLCSSTAAALFVVMLLLYYYFIDMICFGLLINFIIFTVSVAVVDRSARRVVPNINVASRKCYLLHVSQLAVGGFV